MSRRNIYEILHSGEISLKEEYKRFYSLYHTRDLYVDGEWTSIYDLASYSCKFFELNFTNRAVSLSEIESAFGYTFSSSPRTISVEMIVSFGELIVNVCRQLYMLYKEQIYDKDYFKFVERNICDCMNELGYVPAEYKGVFIFVEVGPEAIAVAEISKSALSYKIMQYNHHRLKGQCEDKLAILKLLADDIEDKDIRSKLKNINGTLESQLYQLMNKFVRHDHSQTPEIEKMGDEELEAWYDDIYQMWLLAKLEIDNLDRKKRAAELLNIINGQ